MTIEDLLMGLPTILPEAILYSLLIRLVLRKAFRRKFRRSISLFTWLFLLLFLRKFTVLGEIIDPRYLTFQSSNQCHFEMRDEHSYLFVKKNPNSYFGIGMDSFYVQRDSFFFVRDSNCYLWTLDSREKTILRDDIGEPLKSFYQGYIDYHWYFIPYIDKIYEASSKN